MATSEVVSLLKELKPRLLEGLSSLQVASIAAAATRRRFLAHSVMAHEGCPASHLFLMISGRARSFCMKLQGEKVPISWFPPGEVCGGAAFLSKPVESIVSTEAVNDSTVLVWDRTTIRFLSTQYPRLVDSVHIGPVAIKATLRGILVANKEPFRRVQVPDDGFTLRVYFSPVEGTR